MIGQSKYPEQTLGDLGFRVKMTIECYTIRVKLATHIHASAGKIHKAMTRVAALLKQDTPAFTKDTKYDLFLLASVLKIHIVVNGTYLPSPSDTECDPLTKGCLCVILHGDTCELLYGNDKYPTFLEGCKRCDWSSSVDNGLRYAVRLFPRNKPVVSFDAVLDRRLLGGAQLWFPSFDLTRQFPNHPMDFVLGPFTRCSSFGNDRFLRLCDPQTSVVTVSGTPCDNICAFECLALAHGTTTQDMVSAFVEVVKNGTWSKQVAVRMGITLTALKDMFQYWKEKFSAEQARIDMTVTGDDLNLMFALFGVNGAVVSRLSPSDTQCIMSLMPYAKVSTNKYVVLWNHNNHWQLLVNPTNSVRPLSVEHAQLYATGELCGDTLVVPISVADVPSDPGPVPEPVPISQQPCDGCTNAPIVPDARQQPADSQYLTYEDRAMYCIANGTKVAASGATRGIIHGFGLLARGIVSAVIGVAQGVGQGVGQGVKDELRRTCNSRGLENRAQRAKDQQPY
jgi:hypothetical protein